MAIISPQQILVPKKVYIGDTAELRCTFNNGSETLKQLVANGVSELSLVSQNTTDYDIKSITISPAGVDFYQISVTFIPWKTGELQFPALNIEGSDLTIEFQPVQIVSLVSTDSNNATTLRETASPLLLPGTTYKLYGALTAFIILLIVLIRIIVKRKSILFYFANQKLLRRYKKNKKQTIRSLRQIQDESDDTVAAEKIQKLMRNYLEVRFDYPFTRSATSEIAKGWLTATGGLLSETKEEAFGEIAAGFIRTDFIRYSQDAHFLENEKSELIQNLIKQIDILETEEQEKSSDDRRPH